MGIGIGAHCMVIVCVSATSYAPSYDMIEFARALGLVFIDSMLNE